VAPGNPVTVHFGGGGTMQVVESLPADAKMAA
jgi:hypothetical protein